MFLFLFSLFGQSWATENSDIDVLIKGMVCSFCVQGIEKKFTAEKGVEKVQVDLDLSTVYLWIKDETSLKDKRITAIVQEAGYNVKEIKRKQPPQKP